MPSEYRCDVCGTPFTGSDAFSFPTLCPDCEYAEENPRAPRDETAKSMGDFLREHIDKW